MEKKVRSRRKTRFTEGHSALEKLSEQGKLTCLGVSFYVS